jgi:hypothetical protein
VFFITDRGHDEPTILLTNDTHATPKSLITRYAERMLIENALADAVKIFHIDALSSPVGMKVDFDMALLVPASGLYRLMANRMRGYQDSQARQIFRDLVEHAGRHRHHGKGNHRPIPSPRASSHRSLIGSLR